ncbi:MAG: 6,7-dimethyl-8-ribityllumazine synthase [Alphaproteobacteria bacterium]
MADAPHILIVESLFYPDIAEGLAKGAVAAIEAVGATYERIDVPGAFELPAVISMAARGSATGTGPAFDGYVALGCVIRGETSHYDHVCQEAARGLQELAVTAGLAIGFGVLTCETGEQARVRADPAGKKNAGGRAAEACLRMIALRHEFGFERDD